MSGDGGRGASGVTSANINKARARAASETPPMGLPELVVKSEEEDGLEEGGGRGGEEARTGDGGERLIFPASTWASWRERERPNGPQRRNEHTETTQMKIQDHQTGFIQDIT
jgi:hypothetical protein